MIPNLPASNKQPRPDLARISLVVPVRDEETSISDLLDSLLSQSLRPAEIVIADGGSMDATPQIVEGFIASDARVKLIRGPAALPGRGRNIGAAHASGQWIAFTDAGNRAASDWLQALAQRAGSDPAIDVVYGSFEPVVDSFFKECAAISYVPPAAEIDEGLARPCSIVSALMRRSVWQAVGGFREDLRSAEDLLFIRKVEEKGFRVARAPSAIVYWNIQSNLWRTFTRFVTYARNNIRAGLWREWQAAIFQRYLLIGLLALPALFLGLIWLAVPAVFWLWLLVARAVRALKRNRLSFPAGIGRNVLRLLLLTPIIATIDAAAFLGSLNWLLFDKLLSKHFNRYGFGR